MCEQEISVIERSVKGLTVPAVLQHAWTHKNQLFVGVYEALRACEYPWYVASSKAAHRISVLMGSLLGIDLPPNSPRLFASLVPPEESKVEALRSVPNLRQPH